VYAVGNFTVGNGIIKISGTTTISVTTIVSGASGFGSLQYTSFTNNRCPLTCVLDRSGNRNILYIGGSFINFNNANTSNGNNISAQSLVAFVFTDNSGTTRNAWARVGYNSSNFGTTSPVYNLYLNSSTGDIQVSGLFGTINSGTSGGVFGNTNIRSFFTFNYSNASYASNFITTYISNTYTMSLSLPDNTFGFYCSSFNSGDQNIYFGGTNLTNLYQYSTSDSTTVFNNLNGLCRTNLNNNNFSYNTTTSQNDPPVKNFNTSYINNVI
jgi:hypothetical protein